MAAPFSFVKKKDENKSYYNKFKVLYYREKKKREIFGYHLPCEITISVYFHGLGVCFSYELFFKRGL